jgi:hypothetical protein
MLQHSQFDTVFNLVTFDWPPKEYVWGVVFHNCSISDVDVRRERGEAIEFLLE